MMKHVWTDDLIGVLDAELGQRAKRIAADWQPGNDTDYATSDLIMRLSPNTGETLLTKYWAHLQYISYFVHAALYLATPKLQDMAAKTIAACPDPKKLLQFVGQHIGLDMKGHPGITREAEIAALGPYLAYMAHHEIMDLWETCNTFGWFSLRRSFLDPHLRATNGILYEDEAPTFADLDKIVQNIHWVDHWLERYAKTGATTDMIIARITGWFAQRKTLEALKMVREVLVHIGRRGDLSMLDVALHTPDPCADAIRADAVFAVKRRSLH
jgi:hypothetical protein